jgi:hypothetical protein
MTETTGYILAFAALIAAGVVGIVVLPATARGHENPFAAPRPELGAASHWFRASA